MLVDVDRFKDVNDTFGRDGGDILLCTLAARLQDVLPNTATLARLGADEFAIFVPDLPELAAAARLADVLIEKNQAALDIEQTSITPSISVGIALYPEDGSSAEDLLRLADTAMGVAKAKTESAWAYFAPEMTKETSQRLQMETALRAAEKAGTEWEMHLQPKVCFKTGKIRGAEALVRWRRNGELISPFHFIPIAEQTGVIKSIGQWMLHETCRLQARWKDLYGVYPIAVNVSPKQIEDLGFSKSILRYLDQYGLDGNALEVEITESVLVDNNAAIDLFLKDMKSAGIQIAIDDFGTGYSCLSYLQSLHVDVLKIDRSFVMGLPEDNAIARMILDLASHLKMHTVAEGVETEAQRAWLEANNADLMQGYLFSRPVSVQEYEEKFLAPQRVSHLEMA
jgi:diguanylate cyclase (GGDEF)-like protein